MNNAPPRPDFPSWLPPTLVKELRQGMRTPAFLIMMCAFPILIALGFTLSFLGQIMMQNLIDLGFIKFIGFRGALITGLLLVQPIRAMSGIREEIDARTVDLLSLTRLSARRIVLGKWLSLMFQSLLLIFACLPFLFVMYFFGRVNMVEELYFLVTLIALGGALTASALWVSAYSALLRGIWSFALIWAVIVIIVILNDSSGLSSLDWEKWLYLPLTLIEGALVTLLFLLMAAKRIAPAADNLSASLRKWILLGCAWSFLTALCTRGTFLQYTDFFLTLSWITLGLSTFTLLLESLDPDTTIKRHLCRKNGQKASLFRRIFLLPDQKSALSVLLLYAFLSLPAVALLTLNWSYSWPAPKAVFACWIVGTTAYSIFATSVLLGPVRKQLKSGVFFLALALVGLGSLLASILCKMDIHIVAALVPWGNIFIPGMSNTNSAQSACQIGFCLSLLAMGLTFCLISNKRPVLPPSPKPGPEPSPSSES